MSAKDRFESHPVVFGLTLIAGAFAAGLGARAYLPASSPPQAAVNCQVEGLGTMEANHGQRVSVLQEELVKLEARASDDSLISSYQDKYKESADRIRADIAAENASYEAAVKNLSLSCK